MPQQQTLSNGADDFEQEPLLTSPSPTPTKQSSLPKRKIVILLTMRLAEPINFTIIFPFINDMVFSIGATSDQASVGFYAGIIESLFALSQTLTILYWGSLSDRIGRKPVLLMGLSGVACSAVLFGLSQTFWWAVAARAMAGATNGNVAIVKSVMGEITDETNQARAFSLLPLTWTVGCLIGPLLGGYLSKPAQQYPDIFAKHAWAGLGGLWEKFPFFLPCAISAAITVASIVMGAFLLEETLPELVEKREREQKRPEAARQQSHASALKSNVAANRITNYGAMDNNNNNNNSSAISFANETTSTSHRPKARRASTSGIRVHSLHSGYTPTHTPPRSTCPLPSNSVPDHPTSSVWELLAIGQIQKVMISYAFLALISVALDALMVLYLYEPIKLGGVGFSSDSTGILLSINGLGGALVQLFLFPSIQRKVGTLRTYQLSMFAFPLSVILLPVGNLISRLGLGAAQEDQQWYTTLVWTCLLISTAIRVVGGMAFASNMILVNQCSNLTRGTALGTLNSLAQMSSSFTRAIGPYLANTLFALSVTRGWLGGQLVWLILAFLGMIGPLCCLMIRDLEKDGLVARATR
ncbi:uncharacterized protein MEPE_05048 [Melanopsichium pennsylvanicum]|uniref:Major facilitator superfamily (MFS) profile domain-containing protein n=1 Tax=Melanopsichium pennsylvanicum TaxID=63383 RepID=A0AAJ5C7B5_9BASI|nr:uncharacterized protein MEPE_05048 [Melanopsichium pennsylvanicum]